MKLRAVSALFLVLGFTILASGCATPVGPTAFVILRDVPQRPSFVVIPASYSQEETKFSSAVESVLLRAGVSVIEAPTIKSVTTERGVGTSAAEDQAMGARGGAAAAKVTESYLSYDELTADYVLRSNKRLGEIKIIKRDTAEVLVIFKPPQYDPLFGRRIAEALENLGIPVRVEATSKKK